MNVKEENICRLCLQVAENGFEIIDEITTRMFEVLMLKVNLHISKDPIVCKDCADILKKCSTFKSARMDRKEFKSSFVVDNNRATSESKYVFDDKQDSETVDNFICRFCWKRSSLDILKNEVTFAEKLQVVMPNTDSNIIKSYIICKTCRQKLKCYIKFTENCIDVEEKIIKYCESKGTTRSSIQVKLSDVRQFVFEDIDGLNLHPIKQEEDALNVIGETRPGVYDDILIKDEEALDIKEHGVVFDETDSETQPVVPSYKLNTLNIKNVLEARVFQCANCTFTTKYKHSLKSHMLTHKNVTQTELYKCSKCIYETNRKSNLKRHTLVHKNITDVKMHECSMCTFKTRLKDSLIRHTLIHQDVIELKVHKCSMCTFKTRLKDSLIRHTLIHKNVTEVETYKCPTCTHETKYKPNLKTHMLTHKNITDVKTYNCAKCTYQTNHQTQFIRHASIHEDGADVKMYKCPICVYETRQKRNLRTHTLIHKDVREVETFKCFACTYEAKRKMQLIAHMLVHKDVADIEMHKCSMCTYEAKCKKYLKRHMLVHRDVAEVETHKCEMCNFETKRKYNLTAHIRRHDVLKGGDIGIY